MLKYVFSLCFIFVCVSNAASETYRLKLSDISLGTNNVPPQLVSGLFDEVEYTVTIDDPYEPNVWDINVVALVQPQETYESVDGVHVFVRITCNIRVSITKEEIETIVGKSLDDCTTLERKTTVQLLTIQKILKALKIIP